MASMNGSELNGCIDAPRKAARLYGDPQSDLLALGTAWAGKSSTLDHARKQIQNQRRVLTIEALDPDRSRVCLVPPFVGRYSDVSGTCLATHPGWRAAWGKRSFGRSWYGARVAPNTHQSQKRQSSFVEPHLKGDFIK